MYLQRVIFVSLTVHKITVLIFTERIIYKMIQLEYSVDFTSHDACKSVFKRHRTDLNFDFYSTNTERRSASVNCIIDNTHCIISSF